MFVIETPFLLHMHNPQRFPSNPTTVVSPCLKALKPVLVILNWLPQFGSVHAINPSVVIQSLVCVNGCLAARRGSTDAKYEMLRLLCPRKLSDSHQHADWSPYVNHLEIFTMTWSHVLVEQIRSSFSRPFICSESPAQRSIRKKIKAVFSEASGHLEGRSQIYHGELVFDLILPSLRSLKFHTYDRKFLCRYRGLLSMLQPF